jgi:hypothetical protein
MTCVLLNLDQKNQPGRAGFLFGRMAIGRNSLYCDKQLVFHQLNSSASFLSADLSEISAFAQVAIVDGQSSSWSIELSHFFAQNIKKNHLSHIVLSRTQIPNRIGRVWSNAKRLSIEIIDAEGTTAYNDTPKS